MGSLQRKEEQSRRPHGLSTPPAARQRHQHISALGGEDLVQKNGLIILSCVLQQEERADLAPF